MTTNEQRRLATRAKLIAAAFEHFAHDGYENTRTESILEQAGMSRGAMYHHFSSKRELFEAVFVSVTIKTIEHATRVGSKGESPLADLIAACFSWLRAVKKPDIAAILLDQAPQVLGWKRAREIESEYSLAPMKQSLERAVAAGEAKVASSEFTALLINAVLAEAALEALHGKTKVTAATQEAAIQQLIYGLIS